MTIDYSLQDLDECLSEYTALNVLDYSQDEGIIRLVCN